MKIDMISDMIEGFVDQDGRPVEPDMKVQYSGFLWTVEELCRKYATIVLDRPSLLGTYRIKVSPGRVKLAETWTNS